jgi:hypothetical protein
MKCHDIFELSRKQSSGAKHTIQTYTKNNKAYTVHTHDKISVMN